MKALTFHFSWPRLAAAKVMGTFAGGGYLSGMGPVVKGRRGHAFQIFLDLMAQQPGLLEPLVTHTFSLKHYRQAFLTARHKDQHQSVKVLIELNG